MKNVSLIIILLACAYATSHAQEQPDSLQSIEKSKERNLIVRLNIIPVSVMAEKAIADKWSLKLSAGERFRFFHAGVNYFQALPFASFQLVKYFKPNPDIFKDRSVSYIALANTVTFHSLSYFFTEKLTNNSTDFNIGIAYGIQKHIGKHWLINGEFGASYRVITAFGGSVIPEIRLRIGRRVFSKY